MPRRSSGGRFRRRTRRSRPISISKDEPLRSMTLSQLQNIAKRRGIPFGGLTKDQLYRKIQRY